MDHTEKSFNALSCHLPMRRSTAGAALQHFLKQAPVPSGCSGTAATASRGTAVWSCSGEEIFPGAPAGADRRENDA
jgi:hypothetical protein